MSNASQNQLASSLSGFSCTADLERSAQSGRAGTSRTPESGKERTLDRQMLPALPARINMNILLASHTTAALPTVCRLAPVTSITTASATTTTTQPRPRTPARPTPPRSPAPPPPPPPQQNKKRKENTGDLAKSCNATGHQLRVATVAQIADRSLRLQTDWPTDDSRDALTDP